MVSNLIWAIILTLLPITELRLGLPVALLYATQNNLPTFPIFLLILLLNLILIFIIFFFLDNIHKLFLKSKVYRKAFQAYTKSLEKKKARLKRRQSSIGFLALTLLVAIPLPFTGAYTGSILSWLLDLDRKKSIYAIATGVTIAGIIVYLVFLGFLRF